MIEDKELDKLKESIEMKDPFDNSNLPTTSTTTKDDVIIETQFSKSMDVVKENILKEAAVEDKDFVNQVKETVKQTAKKLTEVEKGKAEYQEQQVDYEKEKLGTQQQKNVHEQLEDKWDNKRKKRQYHYDGVAPIMEFVKIDKPMNLICLYFLTIVLMIPFLIAKFIKGTFGALVAGASDGSRTKAAKGFLWTITCVFATLVIVCLVLLFLKSQGIDVFAKIRN